MADPTKMRGHCETCAWWDEGRQAMGLCKRRAPKRLTRDGGAEWPVTSAIDWCGDWSEHTLEGAHA